jgi:hypothetical protein
MKAVSLFKISAMSIVAVSLLTHCGEKHKKTAAVVAPKVEKPVDPKPEILPEKPVTPEILTQSLAEKCAALSTDSELLTSSLNELCIRSENGANQIEFSFLAQFGDEVRVVKGGDADQGGMSRDIGKLLAVKSEAELKDLICSTHKDLGVEATPRNDLFDIFYVRYKNDDSTSKIWLGATQSGETLASGVDSGICSSSTPTTLTFLQLASPTPVVN